MPAARHPSVMFAHCAYDSRNACLARANRPCIFPVEARGEGRGIDIARRLRRADAATKHQDELDRTATACSSSVLYLFHIVQAWHPTPYGDGPMTGPCSTRRRASIRLSGSTTATFGYSTTGPGFRRCTRHWSTPTTTARAAYLGRR